MLDIRHPIDVWLGKNEKSRAWVAEQLGVSTSKIGTVCTAKQFLNAACVIKLNAITKGDVAPNDLYRFYAKVNKVPEVYAEMKVRFS